MVNHTNDEMDILRADYMAIQDLVTQKNHWLSSQIEVAHPTKESVLGKALYFEQLEKCTHQQHTLSEVTDSDDVELVLVDFHRLTILFSQLQSSRWQGKDSEYIVEFLTQIILDSEPHLYVGFAHGEPTCCAIFSVKGEECLISDVYISPTTNVTPVQLGYQILKQEQSLASQFWLEC